MILDLTNDQIFKAMIILKKVADGRRTTADERDEARIILFELRRAVEPAEVPRVEPEPPVTLDDEPTGEFEPLCDDELCRDCHPLKKGILRVDLGLDVR